jgi:pantoate--beta-alanine ligase
VRQASEHCPIVVVSIFVNPAQFAPHEDLDSYPRTLSEDLELLRSLNCADVVFLPKVKDIYPSGIPLEIEKQIGTFIEVKGKSHQVFMLFSIFLTKIIIKQKNFFDPIDGRYN